MILRIDRLYMKPSYTIGKLYVDGQYFCDTLEDAVRDVKIAGKTAIPAGTYKVITSFSNRFCKIMPEILGVPNFTGVRIHSGNTAADTAGCVLVGENKITGGLIRSRFFASALTTLLAGCREPMTLTIDTIPIK